MVTLTVARPTDRIAFARLRGKHLTGLIVVLQMLALTALIVALPLPMVPVVAVSATALLMLFANGVLGQQLGLSALDRLPRTATAFASATGIVASGLLLAGLSEDAMSALEFGPAAALTSWLMLAISYRVGNYARRRGIFVDRVVVVGAGEVATRIEQALAARPEYGLHAIGYVGPELGPESGPGQAASTSPRLGCIDDLLGIVRSRQADAVIVAYSPTRERQLLAPLRELAATQTQVYVVPRFFEDVDRNLSVGGVWGVPLHRLPMPRGGGVRRVVKRAIDIVLASVALVLLSPVMAVSAILITRETGAGLLFRQIRVGRDEHLIEILKFQTMKPATVAEGDTTWNISHDSRLGPVGKFLRRTSLDELPQLWNVLRGDMSLVGPRPERPHFVDQFKATIPGYSARHRVPVGLTGWAQVNELRGDTSIEDRARFDNAYVASWSPWEDVKIIIRTVPEVIKGSGG